MTNAVIVGASRGLGLALAEALIPDHDRCWLLSREEPEPVRRHEKAHWIRCDLAAAGNDWESLFAGIGDAPVRTFIYNAGVWERDRFDRVRRDFLGEIVNVNLTSLLESAHALHHNIVRGGGNIVLIGSTCGLENEGSSGVGYTAAKFGVRGAAHSLREHFRPANVRVTCLSPGSMATDVPLGQPETAVERHGGARMPVDDIVALVRCVLSLSPATCVKELTVPATKDTDV